MGAGKLIGIVTIMLLPTLIVGAVLYVPRGLRAVRRWAASRGTESTPQPVSAPIEQLAADLRRLLGQHETLRCSTRMAMRAHRLVALEAAIADRASEAAAALGVSSPDRSAGQVLSRPDLRRLLCALGDAGLVLPSRSTLLGVEGHS
jgi:hypothetical protein